MKVWRLVIKEICYRKISFVLGLASVAVAMGCLVGSLTLFEVNDLRTKQILERKETVDRLEHEPALRDNADAGKLVTPVAGHKAYVTLVGVFEDIQVAAACYHGFPCEMDDLSGFADR